MSETKNLHSYAGLEKHHMLAQSYSPVSQNYRPAKSVTFVTFLRTRPLFLAVWKIS